MRSIRPDELDACCALGGSGWLANVVRGIWEERRSSPELSFVAEDGGKPVGRVFFHHRSAPTELAMFGTYVEPAADFVTAGQALLGKALARLTELGVTGVEYAIYDIYDPDPVRYQQLIESAGFRQYQEKKRYVWDDRGTAVAVPARLQFRSLVDVGEDAFTDALARVTEQTLDRQDLARVEKTGVAETARWYMRLLKESDFEPVDWLLGYLADGRLGGLVVPKRIDDKEGTIDYIGVVPELRGADYGFDLLSKGTALLQHKGFKTVVAETDSVNLPFHAELERAGYRHHGTLKCFRRDL